MADPEPFALPDIHPCTPGHGLPLGERRAWVAPEFCYVIACPRCGLGVMAESVDAAMAQWNDLHPARELSEAERDLPPIEAAIPLPPRHYLCEDNVHIIQRLPDGGYACAQCGLGFREHHALDIVVGSGSMTTAT